MTRLRPDGPQRTLCSHSSRMIFIPGPPDHIPIVTSAPSLLQPSTGTFPVSTEGSRVWGAEMAREIMHPAFALRSNASPASHRSSDCTVSRGRIRISLKLHPAPRLRRTLPSISTSRSLKTKPAARATSWNVVVNDPARARAATARGSSGPAGRLTPGLQRNGWCWARTRTSPVQ
jgi:hypothetical protein